MSPSWGRDDLAQGRRRGPQPAMGSRGRLGALCPLSVLRSHMHLSGSVHPLSNPASQHPAQPCLFANISGAGDCLLLPTLSPSPLFQVLQCGCPSCHLTPDLHAAAPVPLAPKGWSQVPQSQLLEPFPPVVFSSPSFKLPSFQTHSFSPPPTQL